jgi:hypothetical protein
VFDVQAVSQLHDVVVLILDALGALLLPRILLSTSGIVHRRFIAGAFKGLAVRKLSPSPMVECLGGYRE